MVKPYIDIENYKKLPEIDYYRSWIDKVWTDMDMNKHNHDQTKLLDFYRHPIWIIVGVFSECKPNSVINRFNHSCCLGFIQKKDLMIFESGGGYGALARIILSRFGERISEYDIIEPYVNSLTNLLSEPFSNLSYLNSEFHQDHLLESSRCH